MKRPEDQEPTVEESAHGGGRSTTERHPAYGMIGASRVNWAGNGTNLFGSDFRHRNTVRIQIHGADVRRDLSHDWIHADSRRSLVEVELSEAQWAGFVSTLNVGDGVACTIRHVV